MSIHPSLSSGGMKKHRSVLKREERIKTLKDREKWKEGDSAFGLPKIKSLLIKLKKTKPAESAEEKAAAAAAEGTPEEETAAPKEEGKKS